LSFFYSPHPGYVKTGMGTENAPLEIEEGIRPIISLINMSDEEFKKFNGKFTNRHLQVFDFLDDNIKFLENII